MQSDSILKQFHEYEEFFQSLIGHFTASDCFLGVTGSAISGQVYNGMDIDLLLILPDALFGKNSYVIPAEFEGAYWRKVTELNNDKVDVIGSFHKIHQGLRLEIYKASAAKRILNGEIFTVSRLKEVPKKTKDEIFFSIEGNRLIRPLSRTEFQSTTPSFILDNNEKFWGMHFERLILSIKIIDSLNIYNEIKKVRTGLINSIDTSKAVKDLFFCTSNKPNINIEEVFLRNE